MADANRGRSLPIAGMDTVRVAGGLGVLACVLCCVSIPSVVAAISALGLGFLRNDRLLFPAEVISLIVLLATFVGSRRVHHRNAPLVAGLLAAAWMFRGLMSPAPLGTVMALSGAVLVVGIVAWDWHLQRRCRV